MLPAVSIHRDCKSVVFSRKSLRTRTTRRSISGRRARAHWHSATKRSRGTADDDAYNQVALVPKERTIKVPSDVKRKRLENLYAQVRKIRESKAGYERLG